MKMEIQMKEENQYANWMTKQWNKNDFSLTEKHTHNVVLFNLLQSSLFNLPQSFLFNLLQS